MNDEYKEKLLSSVLLIGRTPFQAGLLERLANSLRSKKNRHVSSITEAEAEIEKKVPNVIVMDVTDLKSGEFRSEIEPMLSAIPRRIRMFLVDENPTMRRILKAAELGVSGVLKRPSSD